MHYKYRWVYAFLISLFLLLSAYGYDFAPIAHQMIAMQQEEQQLKEKLTAHKQRAMLLPAKVARSAYSSLNAMADLMLQIQLSGLIAKSVKVISATSTTETRLQLVLLGGFQQILAFIGALNNFADLAMILDFSCKLAEQQQLMLSLDLVLVAKNNLPEIIKQRTNIPRIKQYNPFCGATNNNDLNVDNELIMTQSMPITLMKMVGYWQQGHHHQALLLLPNNRMIAVNVGDVIGSERMTVTAIEADAISFASPQAKPFILEKNK